MFLLLITLFFSNAQASGESRLEQALSLLEKNQVDRAYVILDQISVEDQEFVPAIEQMQKIHYQKAEWLKFFGFAAYYRQTLLNSPLKFRKNFNARLIALESVALGRQCQWDAAHRISTTALTTAKSMGLKQTSELEQAVAYLELFHHFPDVVTTRSDHPVPSPFFTDQQFWRVNSSSISKVPHPRMLRMKVESRCKP